MLKLFSRIWRGAGYLEGYGYHPGTFHVIIMIFCCGLAGIDKGGVNGFLGGIAIGAFFFLPIYFAGCYGRTKMYEEDMEKTFNILQKK